jgi:hypothetical protein
MIGDDGDHKNILCRTSDRKYALFELLFLLLLGER